MVKVPAPTGIDDLTDAVLPAGGPADHTAGAERSRLLRSAAPARARLRTDLRVGAAPWFTPALALVAALGLLGRVLFLYRSKVARGDIFFQGDAFWYSTVARAVSDGHGFVNLFSNQPTADHPPLTVLLLTPAAHFFDGSTFAMRMTMVLLSTVTIVVAGLLGRRLAGPVAGVAAAVFVAANPSLWVNDILIMSETPTALLLALVFWAGYALIKDPTPRRAVLTGALCGLATLCRAEIALFLPFMVWPAVAMARHRSTLTKISWAAAAAAAAVAVVAPWTIYNLTRFQAPVAVSTNDGVTLLGANCDPAYSGPVAGGWTIDGCLTEFYPKVDAYKPPLTAAQRRQLASRPTSSPPCPDPAQKRPPCWDSAKVSGLMRTEAVHYIGDHLGELPLVELKRHGLVWGLFHREAVIRSGAFGEARVPWVSRWGFYVTWLLAPLTVAGAVVLRRRGTSLVPFGAALAVVLVITSIFYGLVRFRLPYDVGSSVLCGVAVAAAIDWWNGRRAGRPGPAARSSSPEPSTR